jgi:hypothetical protein
MSKKYLGQFKLSDADGFYQALIDSHNDLSLEDSQRLNARLVLMMANEIGQLDVLKSILGAARENLMKG